MATPTPTRLPLPYTLFFLYIEPVFTLFGFVAAFFMPTTYLRMTDPYSALSVLSLPTATHVTLRQLGNMYMAFALSEALVLRSTTDLRVWRAFLLVLLIADFGHLISLWPLGASVYYDVAKWGPMDWGNVGFVYWGATTRICFLSGVGLGGSGGGGVVRVEEEVEGPKEKLAVSSSPTKVKKSAGKSIATSPAVDTSGGAVASSGNDTITVSPPRSPRSTRAKRVKA